MLPEQFCQHIFFLFNNNTFFTAFFRGIKKQTYLERNISLNINKPSCFKAFPPREGHAICFCLQVIKCFILLWLFWGSVQDCETVFFVCICWSLVKLCHLYSFQQMHCSSSDLISVYISQWKSHHRICYSSTKLFLKVIFVGHKFPLSCRKAATGSGSMNSPQLEGPPASLYLMWCLLIFSRFSPSYTFGWNRTFPCRCVLTQNPGFKDAFVKTSEQWAYSMPHN